MAWKRAFVLWMLLLLVACRRPAYRQVSLQSPEPTAAPPVPSSLAPPPLRIAVAAILSPQRTLHVYNVLAAYLEERLNRPVEWFQQGTYAETNELLRNRAVDLAFICTGAYVRGQNEFAVELLVVPEIHGHTTYRSYIIVPADSPTQRWEDLRGKVFAFTDPLSLSGYMAPLYLLHSAGETPDRFFARTLFTYSHDSSIKAVAERWVDGAAVDHLVYEALRVQAPYYGQRTRVIWESEPFGTPPVVVPAALDPDLKEPLRKIFLEMHTNPDGREVLALLGVDRFVPPDDRVYDSARRVVQTIRGQP